MGFATRVALVLVGLQFIPSVAFATIASDRQLNELASLFQFTEVYQRSIHDCYANVREGHPDRTHDPDTGTYAGIPMGTPEWALVSDAYETYARTVCSALTPEEYLDAYKTVWRERLSAEALTATLEFMRSRSGREYVAALTAGNQHVQAMMAQRMASVSRSALARYNATTKEVSEAYAARVEPWWQRWLALVLAWFRVLI